MVTSPKPSLVLLHPFTSSGRIWDEVVPLLADHHEVHTPTSLGHRGGPKPGRRPVTSADMVDAAERWRDDNGLERPHLVGNSGGGAGAIELARRGRAASVCAISPAGFWSTSDSSAARVMRLIHLGGKVFRATYPIAPLRPVGGSSCETSSVMASD